MRRPQSKLPKEDKKEKQPKPAQKKQATLDDESAQSTSSMDLQSESEDDDSGPPEKEQKTLAGQARDEGFEGSDNEKQGEYAHMLSGADFQRFNSDEHTCTNPVSIDLAFLMSVFICVCKLLRCHMSRC